MIINYDVKPMQVDSAYVEAPFDKAKVELEGKGFRVISAAENAMLRIQEGKDAFISRNGNWTREGFLFAIKPQLKVFREPPQSWMSITKTALSV